MREFRQNANYNDILNQGATEIKFPLVAFTR